MSEQFKSLSEDALETILAAIDANMAEEVAAFGRYLPGAQLREDREARWYLTGLPSSLFNGVQLARFYEGDIDAKIERLLQPFRERALSVSWAVGPASRPTNLRMYLEAHGLALAHVITGMAADLHALNEAFQTPPDLRIEAVRNQEMLRAYATVSKRGFGASPEENEVYYDTYSCIGFADDLPWQHYIGWLDGQPVAVSSLLLHAGVAGVYGVATLPEARRQGVGAAMTLAPLRAARARGYTTGILSPSDMGLRIYQRIGFREYCTVNIYTSA
ncbi:MAG TPA: GNAT family N-acetyltransferase [Ktedonobacteraceae bacterium]|nr:GNAT family N-acetyltransferase [Ktedonobacteraceae bacterium]